MFRKLTLAFCLVALNILTENATAIKENHWAVLVAGSSGWYNYRHQADISHAYQLMLKHGIPADHIITFMFDDIANNEKNPDPGVVINVPNGPNVYTDVKIDYRTEDVTPENFLAVIKGDKEKMASIGSGKVLESGPDDHVFINFADHGAPGLIAFPVTYLYANDFLEALQYMNEQQMYKQMVIYIEACESGSMFENKLPDNVNIYATTAANSKESSYAIFYDKKLETYLGDVYSVYWMMDSDTEDLNSETLNTQFHILLKEVNTSHPQEFGDMSIGKEFVGQFQGNDVKTKKSDAYKNLQIPSDTVASEDVPMAILHHRLEASTDETTEQEIIQQIRLLMGQRHTIDDTMQLIVNEAIKYSDGIQAVQITNTHMVLNNMDCYRPLVELTHAKCFNMIKHDYALRRLFLLVNLCESGVPQTDIMQAIHTVCDLPLII